MVADQAPLVVIVGPTAVGKTALALRLAEAVGGEIISADSMQVYRGMDIGTAKATPAEQERVRHHGIDLVDPSEQFTVADYERMAEQAIASIRGRGHVPILAGGTGLYVKAVVDGLGLSAPGADWELRAELHRLAEERGNAYLHAELERVDPETARRLHPNDRRRVIRALEVYRLSGVPLSVHHARDRAAAQRRAGSRPPVIVGLTRPRPELYNRINERVKEQIRQGLLSEIRGLIHRGFAQYIIARQALGYKEFFPYLEGRQTLQEAVTTLQRATRQFARRQYTWFRRDERIKWMDVGATPPADIVHWIAERLS